MKPSKKSGDQRHAMIDLETWDKIPGAAINAIGLVIFDRVRILEKHYVRVDAQTCLDAGLTIDLGTVHWWMRQSDAARLEVIRPGVSLASALEMLAYWIGPQCDGVWGNGSTFDVSITEAAYRALGREAPWRFWSARCLRTLSAEHPMQPRRRTGVAHNALDDAIGQTRHVLRLWSEQKKRKR